MNFFRKQKRKFFVLAGFVLAVFVFSFGIYKTVATENTNIDSTSKYAWSENAGWLNFRSDGTEVVVVDDKITGYIWSENLGWISLHCDNDNSCSAVDYGVANDGDGNLSGYAWGENIGWMNFAPSDGGVIIDTEGIFSGYAWGENIGWVVFNCSDLDICDTSSFKVKTNWSPAQPEDDDDSDDSSDDDDDDEEEIGHLDVSDVKYSTTDTTIIISWETNRNADSRVRWGKNKNLEEKRNDKENVRKHRIVLKNLEPETTYYFRVKSVDGNEKEDTSRIHSISTKPESSFFAEIPSGSGEEGMPERVEIEVRDKTESEKREETGEIKTAGQAGDDSAPQESRAEEYPAESSPSVFSRMFSWTGDAVLGAQRKLAGFFGWTGNQIAELYNDVAVKFSEKKAAEIARMEKAKFYTTKVFKHDNVKFLAEVRFQIFDRSDNPIPNLETRLFSEPKTAVTDENGVVAFSDVPVGGHTLAFSHQDENFEKKVSIADTLTEEGQVRAEVVGVKADKEKITPWMWIFIILFIASLSVAVYFARKYYRLKTGQTVVRETRLDK